MNPVSPVFPGLDQYEVTKAKDQPEYQPLPVIVSKTSERAATSRWTFTDEERQAIALGADLFICQLTFGTSLQPIMPVVLDIKEVTTDDVARLFGLEQPLISQVTHDAEAIKHVGNTQVHEAEWGCAACSCIFWIRGTSEPDRCPECGGRVCTITGNFKEIE